ncbi:hypothetical protein DMN91_005441 [Ooceraea biroi]|uniref:Uncharacterized protein n=1 Tax=Ooceraea biroi TaxID=2015173 RepID=A0A3L8DSL6_OOCBI|nr:hypothetical protein DMN91_005441 [Ooceraea biroi]
MAMTRETGSDEKNLAEEEYGLRSATKTITREEGAIFASNRGSPASRLLPLADRRVKVALNQLRATNCLQTTLKKRWFVSCRPKRALFKGGPLSIESLFQAQAILSQFCLREERGRKKTIRRKF